MKRPTWIIPVMLLWTAAAAYGLWVTLYLYGPSDSKNLYVGCVACPWFHVVTDDVALRLLIQVLSVFQIVTAFAIMKGRVWAHYAGLLISVLVMLAYTSLFLAYYSVPVIVGLRTPLVLVNLAVGGGSLAMLWLYLRRPNVVAYIDN
ncbi:MAG: hypothetical protein HY247_00145 [archaeon]|nr:MAG: hypothetical protein HY247_00145 [archaeon]